MTPLSLLSPADVLLSGLMASGATSRSEDEESLAGQKRGLAQASGAIPKRRSSSRYARVGEGGCRAEPCLLPACLQDTVARGHWDSKPSSFFPGSSSGRSLTMSW